MRHQLKAVFDDRGKAQQALDTLLGSGYASADAFVVAVPGPRDGKPGDADAPSWRERPGAWSARFLSTLLRHERKDPARSAKDSRSPDSYVLTLATCDDAEAERAASLISSVMRAGRSDKEASPSAPAAGAAACTHWGSSAAGTPRDSGREAALPAGYWPGTPPQGPLDRAVGAGPFASAVDALPAYRFGHDMHENDRYRNRSWNEAAGDLKVLWEAHAPDGPAWESSAPVIRQGWNSSSPEIDDDSYHRSHWKTAYAASPAGAASARIPGTGAPAAATWKTRHPGELTPWENFIDALRHGWERIRIGNDLDEADYRLHHAQTYPGTNYDDLAPVYRYGNNIRRRSAFRGLGWDAVESAVRAEWERGHREGKPATWDELKPALRHGWDQPKS